jgi:glycerophosphoryl diester phosphodiesterase
LICVSCSKDPAIFTLNNINDNNIGCFGHAGMGSLSIYPVNTFESLKSCLDRGADGTEMDIQVTKDSVLVIYHDDLLNENTSCSGIIKDLNWSDLNNCQMNSTLFKNLELISFDEFIQKIPNPYSHIFTLDCKSRINIEDNDAYFKLFARTLVNTINKYHLTQNIFIENPAASFLNYIKNIKSDAKLFFLAGDFEGGLKAVKKWNYYGLSMHTTKITAEQIKIAHSQNVRVTLYGVLSDKENYLAVEKSPDFIQTDNITYLLKIFGKYNKNKGYVYSMSK